MYFVISAFVESFIFWQFVEIDTPNHGDKEWVEASEREKLNLISMCSEVKRNHIEKEGKSIDLKFAEINFALRVEMFLQLKPD